MSDYAIQAHKIGKQYHIGRKLSKDHTLRDAMVAGIARSFRRLKSTLRGGEGLGATDEMLWVLRDVSFDIKRGEVVGIIGRNGAGKSTLLKILSRITEPSAGSADIYGRVGSLLEVGTGFHPELTGRENIYLNGAILGMKRIDIENKFDEIVAFAEVDRFIDTPVKHYSSGMYLRLAFAVAAHLEPEILLVDEVLAVGDAQFQKKCLNKMEDVGQQGRTVLFVSHNMPAITRLCGRTILLDEGRVVADGPSAKVVGSYLSSGLGTMAAREWSDPATAPGGEVVRLCAARVCAENGQITDAVDIRQAVDIEMEYDVLKAGYVILPHYALFNEDGTMVFVTVDVDPTWRGQPRPEGRYTSAVRVPGNYLAEGTLFVSANMTTLNPNMLQFAAREAVAFEVIDGTEGDSARGDWAGPMPGVMRPLLEWRTHYEPIAMQVLQK